MATSNSPDSSTPAELAAPYGNGPTAAGTASAAGAFNSAGTEASPKPAARIRTHHLQKWKAEGEAGPC